MQFIFYKHRWYVLSRFQHFILHQVDNHRNLRIIRFPNSLVTFHLPIFIYKYHNILPPSAFLSIKRYSRYTVTTHLAKKRTYYFIKVKTNNGILNNWYQGPKMWNILEENMLNSPLSTFKLKLKKVSFTIIKETTCRYDYPVFFVWCNMYVSCLHLCDVSGMCSIPTL